jgi:hypothetical protein
MQKYGETQECVYWINITGELLEENKTTKQIRVQTHEYTGGELTSVCWKEQF